MSGGGLDAGCSERDGEIVGSRNPCARRRTPVPGVLPWHTQRLSNSSNELPNPANEFLAGSATEAVRCILADAWEGKMEILDWGYPVRIELSYLPQEVNY